ncbi:hypothetical protein ACFFKU_07375 [Kineococcus gynurae]|uniref:Right handed beta helix domain-containing protein n=1 Tax=Kineococcus gynurae TaxID=452979 RepID=A0ABV5LWM6_9ACTN
MRASTVPPTAIRPARVPAVPAFAAVVAALAALLVSVLVAVPAQAAISPWMSWNGVTVNKASIPADGEDITTITSVAFDRGTYLVSDVVRGQIGTITTGNDATYRGTGEVDLRGLSGSITLTARLYRGKYLVQTVYKSFKVVPLDTGIPAGFPTLNTTGVPVGTTLTPSGDLVVSTPGTVVQNLDITGCVTVTAADVTIRKSRIRCAGAPLAVTLRDAPRFVLEDSEIDGRASTTIAIGWSDYTLRRVNVHGTFDGPRLGNDVLIEDSYVHSLVRDDSVHTDAAQSTSGVGIVLRRNTFMPDPADGLVNANSALQFGTETGQQLLDKVVIEGNYFDGGMYTVNIKCSANLGSVTFTGNKFGHTAKYGPALAPRSVSFATNTFADTATAIPVSRCN